MNFDGKYGKLTKLSNSMYENVFDDKTFTFTAQIL